MEAIATAIIAAFVVLRYTVAYTKMIDEFGVALAVLVFVALTSASTAAATTKNNLVVVLTDQQRWNTIRLVQDELGVPEKSRIITPNLDRIAREGAYFRNAYTHCAVCGPARASLLTGSTVENTGIRTNYMAADDSLPGTDAEYKLPNLRTYDEILVEDHGYIAEYYGKWHIPNFKGYVYNNDVRRASGISSWFGKYDGNGTEQHMSWGMTQWYRLWLTEQPNATAASKPVEKGDQVNQFSKYYFKPDPLDPTFGLPSDSDYDGKYKQNDQHGQNRLHHTLSCTSQQTSEAIEAMERLAAGDKPFSLHLSLHSPHPPMIPTRKYYEMYNPDDLETPVSLNDDMKNSAYSPNSKLSEGYRNPAYVRRWKANYYGLITEIDDWMGVLLSKLDELGIGENTLLAFSSDHGEMLGGHGLRDKNNFYEESSHVPLLLYFPGVIPAGIVVDDPVSHLDLHSTFLDYSVGRTDYKSDGRSLRNNIEGTDGADSFTVTMRNYTEARFGYNPTKSPAFMIRKGTFKLIVAGQADNKNVDMLYNLDNDPAEMNNLIGKNGDTASVDIISKAEHLKALLVNYLRESNHPATEEIQKRRTWPPISFWSGDYTVNFRDALRGTRTEYIYLGTPTLTPVSVFLEGDSASRYSLKLESQYGIDDDGFSVVAVRYSSIEASSDLIGGRNVQTSVSTTLVIRLDTGEEKRIALIPPDQATTRTVVTVADDAAYSDSLDFILDLTRSTPPPTVTKAPTFSPIKPSSCSGPSILGPGDKLYADEEPHFICSPNGYYKFGIASDGDLSLWHGSNKIWSADTCCTGVGAYALMQSRGNLVVYSFVEEDSEDLELTKTSLWSSRSGQNPPAALSIDNDGHVKIQATDGTTLWDLGDEPPPSNESPTITRADHGENLYQETNGDEPPPSNESPTITRADHGEKLYQETTLDDTTVNVDSPIVLKDLTATNNGPRLGTKAEWVVASTLALCMCIFY